MPCADRVPVTSPHSTMHWHIWVVPIAGSTGSATCCSPSQSSHHAGCPAGSRSRRKGDGFFVALALGHHGPSLLAILFASAMAATLVGRRANNAVSQGRCFVPWI